VILVINIGNIGHIGSIGSDIGQYYGIYIVSVTTKYDVILPIYIKIGRYLKTMVQPFAKNLILCSKLVYASAIQFLDSNLDLRITFIQLQTFPSDHNFRLAASRKMLQPKGTVPHRDQNQIILLLINQIQRKVQR